MKKFTKKEVSELLDRLNEAYPEAQCSLDHETPYQLLVSVTLSAQTTDASVNKVTPALFDNYPDAAAMAKAEVSEVEDMIRTIGLYRTKAARIVEQAQALMELYGGEVPADDALLRKLPGVGRKTANVVMADAFGAQRIAVDTHVFRLANRIGLAKAKNVDDTEDQLKSILPAERLTEAHHSLIFHGRKCCAARDPKCEACPIGSLCRRIGVDK